MTITIVPNNKLINKSETEMDQSKLGSVYSDRPETNKSEIEIDQLKFEPVYASMSSLEIANLTGKNHYNVMRDIKKTLEEVEIGALKFEGSYFNSQNKEQPCYNLPRRECDLVISGYSAKYRLAIIKRWHELENTAPKPMTLVESLKLNLEQAQQNERNQIVIKKQWASLEHKDNLILATNKASIEAGNILVREFCKSVDFVDVGQNKMYEWLRSHNYVNKSNEPYQKYIKLGYFSWKPWSNDKNGKSGYTLMITPRGKVKLTERYMNYLDNE